MPVTARLSQLFYERVGEQVANELVDWFNAVDATYRSDLRELNELNFARFDAKLEQRVGTLEARLEQRMSTLEAKLEQRVVTLEARLNERIAALETKLDTKIDRTASDLRTQLADQRADLLKWMFVFWAGTVLPLAGLILALRRL